MGTGRPLAPLTLTDEERDTLVRWAQRPKTAQALACRAKMVLACAAGNSNDDVAQTFKVTRQTVGKWRGRFIMNRLDGLLDEPRPGAPREISDKDVERVITMTLESTPRDATHWSTRSMAAASGLSQSAISRIWRAFALQPHRCETFKLSTDPLFIEKVRDIVGLYLNPPERALVLCVDEKSQIQALDRTQPGLPMKRGRNGTRTHDYVRHGTCCLFAALNVLNGEVLAQVETRHRHQEYLGFLRLIDRSTPRGLDVHLIADNYCTHKHHKVAAWLQKHPRFHVHFIPTSSSWLNLVERFFGKITDERIRRGVFHSVIELIEAIHEYIEQHNRSPKPFVWTKDADAILAKLKPIAKQLNKTLH